MQLASAQQIIPLPCFGDTQMVRALFVGFCMIVSFSPSVIGQESTKPPYERLLTVRMPLRRGNYASDLTQPRFR